MRIENLAYYFNAGGPFMWSILLVAALATAVVIERLIFYYITCREKGAVMVPRITTLLDQKNRDSVYSVLAKGSNPLIILLRVAHERFAAGMTESDIRDGIEERAVRELPRLTQRLNYLSLFANVSTLLGLLGTISGLMASFSALGTVEAAKKAALLASGISEAMVTTAFGLIVAVPCMVAYTILFNRQQRIARDLDEGILRFVNFLKKARA